MKMSVRPELTTAPPARVRDMRHTDGAVDNSALLPNHPGSTYKSGNAVQTAGATSFWVRFFPLAGKSSWPLFHHCLD